MGYEESWVNVRLDDDSIVSALTYLATKKDATLRPYTWYVKHVLVGAKDFSFPDSYVAEIQAVEAVRDSNLAKENEELSIYKEPKN